MRVSGGALKVEVGEPEIPMLLKMRAAQPEMPRIVALVHLWSWIWKRCSAVGVFSSGCIVT
jgi:hypothetical protein